MCQTPTSLPVDSAFTATGSRFSPTVRSVPAAELWAAVRQSITAAIVNLGPWFADLDGGKNGMAIYTSSGNSWYYSKYTTVTESGSRITITPKQHRITLYGNAPDASHGGQSTVTLTPYYGDFFSLYDYTFQRPGYTQVAWTKDSPSGSAPLPLDYEIWVEDSDASYYAYWVPAEPGDVILNALNGKLPGGSFYQKSSGPVTLPQVDFEDDFQNLIGWCTLAEPEFGDDPEHVLPGQWYEAGDTIPAFPDRVTQLYARGSVYFGYYVYHPGAGSVANGGTVLVQTIYASSLLDSSYLIPPSGIYLCRLVHPGKCVRTGISAR